jgi:Protein of unknown function (DUF3131)
MNLSRREALQMSLCFAGTLTAQGLWSPAHSVPQKDFLKESVLKRDAEIAWRFFSANYPGVDKGLVPAATWPEDDSFGRYDILTMWDAGSLILANISARSIGLIDEKEFDQRTKAVMVFLRRSEFRWGKLVLPNYRTANSGGRTIEPGYDATDTGRLLIALHILDQATNGAYKVKEQVARWDLAGTVVNGKLQDIKSGDRSDSQCFNYIHYIARGYKLWGIEAKTGFDRELAPGDEDARAAFLAHVASIGPIASEPSATEALEIGHSARSRILADVLYAAQKERFAETGHLTCVSEAPIDKKPWFTYQGYNLNTETGVRWPVDAQATAQKWTTREFAESFRMVSCKAAYLWFAERGDDYAAKLREHVLAKAPSASRGFQPGVYEASGRAPKLMDVNTNAAVLESIAYIQSGRKPLAEIRL